VARSLDVSFTLSRLLKVKRSSRCQLWRSARATAIACGYPFAPIWSPTGITIAVVEDNTDSREVLCAMLRKAGLVCHDAPDGVTGPAAHRRGVPGCHLLDVGLPDMDGLEVARRIRGNPRHAHARLIALTGYGHAGDRVPTTQAGFDHHLVKPVQPAELMTLLA
jgi:CheY-like chemotaxis protein